MKEPKHRRGWTSIWAMVCMLVAAPVWGQQSPSEILAAVVGLRSTIPADARTAPALGTERAGSGVVIDDNGLVLTIGYLILEASSVTVTTKDKVDVEARIIAYDHATGFGLVRADAPLGVSHLEFGDSAQLQEGDPVLAITSTGAEGVTPAKVVDRRDFSGYWEYLLENAIFVSPPHRFFAGSALIGPNSKLVGIGSLIVSDAVTGENTVPGNMFVPIDALKPILQSLVETGRDPRPRRPWVGIFTEEYRGHVFVTRIAPDSPAMAAGIKVDDIILRVGDDPVATMAAFFRAMWGLGNAGVLVPLTVLRGGEVIELNMTSTDRYKWLRLAPERMASAGCSSMVIVIDRYI